MNSLDSQSAVCKVLMFMPHVFKFKNVDIVGVTVELGSSLFL